MSQEEIKQLRQDIFNLRIDLSKTFSQTGPNSPKYTELSIKLESLLKAYYEVQLLTWIHVLKDELIEISFLKGLEDSSTIEASQKLDQLIIQYQKLKDIS
jgi:hypothetical protein